MPSKTRRLNLILLLLLLTACTALKKDQVFRTQNNLQSAGFQQVAISLDALKLMPQHQLIATQQNNQQIYQYADAEFCQCLYQGNLPAFQSYVDLIEQQNAAAVSTYDPEQDAENMRAMPFFRRR